MSLSKKALDATNGYKCDSTFSCSNTLDSGSGEASLYSDFKESKEGVWGGEGGCECEGETVRGVGRDGDGRVRAGEVCRGESRVA